MTDFDVGFIVRRFYWYHFILQPCCPCRVHTVLCT